MVTHLKRIPVAWLALLSIVLAHLAYLVSQWHHIPLRDGTPIGPTDPDPWLRLTLVREWLMGGSWYDHSVPRSNAPFSPAQSPWTRPVDLVLAAIVYLQPETAELSTRLMRAALLLPWLWMGLLIAGIHRAIRYLMPLPSAYVMACLLIATMPMLWNYFGLGNADHHAPLAVLFVWAIGGVLSPNPRPRLMLLSGFFLGLQLWVSVEALMLIGIIYAWFGLAWLAGDCRKARDLGWLSAATSLTASLAAMIEIKPDQWLTPVYDSISIVYVYTLIVAALLAQLLAHFNTPLLRGRLLVATLGGATFILAIGAAYPHLPQGPLYGLHPYIATDFLPRISEAKPFYKLDILPLIANIYLPVLALIVCLMPRINHRRAFYAPHISANLAFFVAATLLLYAMQQRWSYYSLPMAFIALAPFLGALFTPTHPLIYDRWPANLMRAMPEQQQPRYRLPIMVVIIATPMTLMVLSTLPFFNTDTPKDTRITQERNSCYNAARQLIRSGELDRVLPTAQTILAPTDLGTEILFFTHHHIIASNYHREGEAIKFVWDTDKITTQSELRQHFSQRNIGAMLLCPMLEFAPGSLTRSYSLGGTTPQWLKRVDYSLHAPNETTSEKSSVTSIHPVLLIVDQTNSKRH